MKFSAVLLSLCLLNHADAERLGERNLSFACAAGYQPKMSIWSFGCDPCAPGTYKTAVGKTYCLPCPAGQYNTGTKNTGCNGCGGNTVQPSTGQDHCEPCGAGATPNPNRRVCDSPSSPADTPSPTDPPTPAPTDSPFMDGNVKMDPHIQKWDGTWYDYNGQCDLVFLKSANFDGTDRDLTIHVRTAIRGGYSFISSAALQIGDNTLEFSSWGQLNWDGIALDADRDLNADPTFAGYQLSYEKKDKKSHTFTVSFRGENKLTFSSFKDFVNVNVHMSKDLLKSSVGLMGDINTGSALARDGMTVIEDPNEFGQEWQVQGNEDMLFAVNREPQAPAKCILPAPREERADTQEEALLRQAATKTCHQFAPQNMEACVADVMATGNLEFAKSGVY